MPAGWGRHRRPAQDCCQADGSSGCHVHVQTAHVMACCAMRVGWSCHGTGLRGSSASDDVVAAGRSRPGHGPVIVALGARAESAAAARLRCAACKQPPSTQQWGCSQGPGLPPGCGAPQWPCAGRSRPPAQKARGGKASTHASTQLRSLPACHAGKLSAGHQRQMPGRLRWADRAKGAPTCLQQGSRPWGARARLPGRPKGGPRTCEKRSRLQPGRREPPSAHTSEWWWLFVPLLFCITGLAAWLLLTSLPEGPSGSSSLCIHGITSRR